MAQREGAGSPRLTARGAARLGAAGTMLLIFGIMGTSVGAILGGMCFIGSGALCQGTMIGEMGGGALMLGLPLLIAGAAMIVGARRAGPPVPAARAELVLAVRKGAAPLAVESPATREGPVASDCPRCGGPVPRDADECEWCGQPFR